MQAALGNASVERNGHHYFAGLSGWPKSVWPQITAKYPDLYAADATGCPYMKVERGRLELDSVNANAFGGSPVALGDAGEAWLEQD